MTLTPHSDTVSPPHLRLQEPVCCGQREQFVGTARVSIAGTPISHFHSLPRDGHTGAETQDSLQSTHSSTGIVNRVLSP